MWVQYLLHLKIYLCKERKREKYFDKNKINVSKILKLFWRKWTINKRKEDVSLQYLLHLKICLWKERKRKKERNTSIRNKMFSKFQNYFEEDEQ